MQEGQAYCSAVMVVSEDEEDEDEMCGNSGNSLGPYNNDMKTGQVVSNNDQIIKI